MKERAAQIGAEIEFDSAPGRGATVTIVAPVGRAAAAAVHQTMPEAVK
jgi:nitrate/nitrite-specific signal transduction histidine kinase